VGTDLGRGAMRTAGIWLVDGEQARSRKELEPRLDSLDSKELTAPDSA
jgi:hypothetical protein